MAGLREQAHDFYSPEACEAGFLLRYALSV